MLVKEHSQSKHKQELREKSNIKIHSTSNGKYKEKNMNSTSGIVSEWVRCSELFHGEKFQI